LFERVRRGVEELLAPGELRVFVSEPKPYAMERQLFRTSRLEISEWRGTASA
jgi:hypothetical protein